MPTMCTLHVPHEAEPVCTPSAPSAALAQRPNNISAQHAESTAGLRCAATAPLFEGQHGPSPQEGGHRIHGDRLGELAPCLGACRGAQGIWRCNWGGGGGSRSAIVNSRPRRGSPPPLSPKLTQLPLASSNTASRGRAGVTAPPFHLPPNSSCTKLTRVDPVAGCAINHQPSNHLPSRSKPQSIPSALKFLQIKAHQR